MTTIRILVDYDNLDQSLRGAGPIAVGRILAAKLPDTELSGFSGFEVRLYGGWRSGGNLTTSAQRLTPIIHAGAPTIVNRRIDQTARQMRLSIVLADRPLGPGGTLQETLAKNRSLRQFRAEPQFLSECVDITGCAMRSYYSLSPTTGCANAACNSKLGSLLVRDEQKMVDTLIVADMAYDVFVNKTSALAVVSSDSDIWPGILLALGAGCRIMHIHSRPRSTTQHHLLQTIGAQIRSAYQQLSV